VLRIMRAKKRSDAEEEPLLTVHAVKVGVGNDFASATAMVRKEEEEEEGHESQIRKTKPIHRALDCLAFMFFVVILVLIREIIYGSGHSIAGARRSRQHSEVKTNGVAAVVDSQTAFDMDSGLVTKELVSKEAAKQHVVLIYIDDQGYNDMGSQSTDLSELTPNIMEVASEGRWITNYYSQALCTPARAALMTGMFPMHIGMQHGFIAGNDPWGLPTDVDIFPQYLKTYANYSTHIVGKWHLGHFSLTRTPLNRGFDTFYGYYSGFEGYFDHTAEHLFCEEEHDCFQDLRQNHEPVISREYNTYLFMDEAKKIISTHDISEPLFLYYALGNVHMPNEVPNVAMQSYKSRLEHIPGHERRVFGAMTMILDDAVGDVIGDLKSRDMYDNTIVVIASDNGAMPLLASSGSNWPLRGMKGSLFEGGIRVHALVRTPQMPVSLRGTNYEGLFHVSDWLPTIMHGVFGVSTLSSDLDGISQWEALHDEEKERPRTKMVHNVDLAGITSNGTYITGAMRVGDYKLLVNVVPDEIYPVANEMDGAQINFVSGSGGPQDFLFDISKDPTEGSDLKDSMPSVYKNMMNQFHEAASSVVSPQYCGIANNVQATKVFQETGFVGPWREDDVDLLNECLTPGSGEEQKHLIEAYCLYHLLPGDACPEVVRR
jgi:arylsulfatase A-like enzyme